MLKKYKEYNRKNFPSHREIGLVLAVKPSVHLISSIMKKYGSEAIMSLKKAGFNFSNLDRDSLKYIIDENGVESISILKDAGADFSKLEDIKLNYLSLDEIISLGNVGDESIYSAKKTSAKISLEDIVKKGSLEIDLEFIDKITSAAISSNAITVDSIATDKYGINKEEVVSDLYVVEQTVSNIGEALDWNIDI